MSYPVETNLRNFQSYETYVRNLRRLDKDEEYDLLLKSKAGDLEATQKLITHNLWLVLFVVGKAKVSHRYRQDAIQQGNIGLMLAIKKFEPSEDVRISSYAVHYITAEVKEFYLKNQSAVNIATTKVKRKLMYNLPKIKDDNQLLSHKEAEVIAKEYNTTPSIVMEVDVRLYGSDIELDDPDNTYDIGISNIDIDDETDYRRNMLEATLPTMMPRRQEVIRRRYLSGETQEKLIDIAKDLGVSIERVRQIEAESIKFLRSKMHEQSI